MKKVIIALGIGLFALTLSCKDVESDDISVSALRTWTAPSDSGGFVVEYDMRYTDDTNQSWDFWTQIDNEPVPSVPGTPESLTISIPMGTWFMAIKSRDDSWNWSDISNIIQVKIDTIPPVVITDFN